MYIFTFHILLVQNMNAKIEVSFRKINYNKIGNIPNNNQGFSFNNFIVNRVKYVSLCVTISARIKYNYNTLTDIICQ